MQSKSPFGFEFLWNSVLYGRPNPNIEVGRAMEFAPIRRIG